MWLNETEEKLRLVFLPLFVFFKIQIYMVANTKVFIFFKGSIFYWICRLAFLASVFTKIKNIS